MTRYENPNIAWYARRSELDTDRVVCHCEPALHRHVRGNVLDIGAGQGHLTAALTYHNRRGNDPVHNVTVLEGSAYNAKLLEPGHWKVVLHDIDTVPFPFKNASFDTIICTDVIEHVLSPYLLLVEMHRLLTPGGTIILITPDSRRVGITIPHIYYFTPRTISLMFERTGYTNIHRVYNGILNQTLTRLTSKIPMVRAVVNNGCYYTATKPSPQNSDGAR